MNIKERIGNKIKKIRLENEMSQEKLAFIANIDRTYISSMEKGERNISVIVLEKLAKALNVEIIELLK